VRNAHPMDALSSSEECTSRPRADGSRVKCSERKSEQVEVDIITRSLRTRDFSDCQQKHPTAAHRWHDVHSSTDGCNVNVMCPGAYSCAVRRPVKSRSSDDLNVKCTVSLVIYIDVVNYFTVNDDDAQRSMLFPPSPPRIRYIYFIFIQFYKL
jgi:hypothetical protein